MTEARELNHRNLPFAGDCWVGGSYNVRDETFRTGPAWPLTSIRNELDGIVYNYETFQKAMDSFEVYFNIICMYNCASFVNEYLANLGKQSNDE